MQVQFLHTVWLQQMLLLRMLLHQSMRLASVLQQTPPA
jgi:hypothetical protein